MSTALLFLTLMSLQVLHADDRVLLIGVGEYADPTHNLHGIDLDLNTMRRVARNIGFDESSIKVLADAEATSSNVEHAMRTWLIDGVESDDRVLIYFSGHGTQVKDINGDEQDGVDEALALHDLSFSTEGLAGVLLDDRFHEILSEIPSDNVYLIVDACHSGTGYRAINDAFTGVETAQVKSYRYAGMPTRVRGGFATAETESGPERFVALMAAADDEQSLATSSGSMFTLALASGIDKAIEAHQPVSPRDLLEYSTRVIKAALEKSAPQRMFTPQMDGDVRLLDKPLQVSVVSSRYNQLRDLMELNPGLALSANENRFAVGDTSLRIDVDVPHDGFLNIVAVNPHDQAVVLFPNAFNLDNKVMPGTLTLPTDQMQFDFRAAKPVGDTTFFAFLSHAAVDLYASGLGEQVESGEFKRAVLAKLSERGTRSIRLFAGDAGMLAGAMTIKVVE